MNSLELLKKQKNTWRNLRWGCRSVILLTALFSTWANVLHSEKDNWIAYVFSGAPPVIVLLGFEFVSRIPMDRSKHWLPRAARVLAVVAISSIGAYLSYRHQNSAILKYMEDVEAANLLPIAIDGLMIIASVSLIQVNEQASKTDALIHSETTRSARQTAKATAEVPSPRKPVEARSKREVIASLLAARPDLKNEELAKLAGVSTSYFYNIKKELDAEKDAVTA